MNDLYREGYEYVICDECQSHILIEPESGWLEAFWEDGLEEVVISFTCDWEPCLADFWATVKRSEKTA